MIFGQPPTPTPYSSLPNVPTAAALPGGVPYGPWGPLYRSAPGAQLPATYYPGMTRYPGHRRGMSGALGNLPVTFVNGFGQAGPTTLTGMLMAATVSAVAGAAYAMARDSRRPVLNPALVMGGLTFGGALLAKMFKNNGA